MPLLLGFCGFDLVLMGHTLSWIGETIGSLYLVDKGIGGGVY